MDWIRTRLIKSGNFFDRILNVFAILSGIIISFLTVVVTLTVVMRYFLNRPLGWVMEISEYGLLYMNFLVVAWVLKKGGHVKVDILFNWLNPRNQLRMDIFTSIIAGIASLLITVYGAKVTWHLFKTGYYTPTILELPKFIIIAIIPIGFLLLFIQFIRKTYDHIKNYRALRINKEG